MNWTYFFVGIFGGSVCTSLIIMNSYLASISRSLRGLNDRDRYKQEVAR